jgi:hypothetical protein
MSACRLGLRYELQLTSEPSSMRSVCSAHAASSVRLAAQREEVIPVEGDVGAHVLDPLQGLADELVAGVLRSDLHADAHGAGGCGEGV